MIIFLNLKKRIINDRALTVLALISINNGDIASAKSLLENCVENKDSAYFYEISLLKNYVFNGIEKGGTETTGFDGIWDWMSNQKKGE